MWGGGGKNRGYRTVGRGEQTVYEGGGGDLESKKEIFLLSEM